MGDWVGGLRITVERTTQHTMPKLGIRTVTYLLNYKHRFSLRVYIQLRLSAIAQSNQIVRLHRVIVMSRSSTLFAANKRRAVRSYILFHTISHRNMSSENRQIADK